MEPKRNEGLHYLKPFWTTQDLEEVCVWKTKDIIQHNSLKYSIDWA